MKKYQTIIAILGIGFISGCAAVPRQVVDAMEMQQGELKRVKAIYFENMNNQLDAIEKYRMAILDFHEELQIAKHSKSLDKETIDGVSHLKVSLPTGDKEVDLINLGKLKDIQGFFGSERDKVRQDIQLRRMQLNLANQNFENIEQINSVMNDYLQSLTRLKNSRDKLASAIRAKLGIMNPIPFSFENIPDPKTIEDIVQTLTLK